MRRLQLRVNECVVLRQIAEEDAEELSALIDRNRVHLREWLPWLDNSNGIHDTARFIGRSLEQAADDNGFTFAIVCDGVLTGVIGQHYLDSLNRGTELGYWLDALHQGRGIVTQSTARLTDYAFTEHACNRVTLHCAFGNLKIRKTPTNSSSSWPCGPVLSDAVPKILMEKIMEERKVVGKRLEKRFSAIELNHLPPWGACRGKWTIPTKPVQRR